MKFPERYRHEHPFIPLVSNDNELGFFRIVHPELNNHIFNVIANNGSMWEHLAITLRELHKRPIRCPYWEEMCFIKNLFWDKEEAVMQLHPPESDYINNHPYCLHLWRPKHADIPLPPSIMVGVKNNY